MKLELKITINNVEEWTSVDWKDDADRIATINQFRRDVKDALTDHAGVDYNKIEIEKIELKP